MCVSVCVCLCVCVCVWDVLLPANEPQVEGLRAGQNHSRGKFSLHSPELCVCVLGLGYFLELLCTVPSMLTERSFHLTRSQPRALRPWGNAEPRVKASGGETTGVGLSCIYASYWVQTLAVVSMASILRSNLLTPATWKHSKV